MAGESQATPESVPDPSVLTTDSLIRFNKAERDYVDGLFGVVMAHIERMDKATEVLSETVNRTPTDIQREIKHLREYADSQVSGLAAVVQQRKEAVDKHFDHLDKVRGEDKREAREMVNLALSAEKDARAVALTTANMAIAKAQESTDKRYDQLDKSVAELRGSVEAKMPRLESEARHSAHETSMNTLSSQIVALVNQKAGGKEQLAGIYAAAGFIVALLAIAGVLAASGAFAK